MNAPSETMPATRRVTRRHLTAPILFSEGPTSISIRAGSVIEVDGRVHTFARDTPIEYFDTKMTPGMDYGLSLDSSGRILCDALARNPLDGRYFGGFHFAPGGCATARSGGDSVAAINPHSIWDIGFRPSCDPRGMSLVEQANGKRFWADIYLLGVGHDQTGTSRHGCEIADGRSLAKLDYPTSAAIYAAHGKRLMTYDEFREAAFGVTEKSSADRDPKTTGLDAAHTSRFGLMQATGNLWVWGTDGDPDDPRPSLFGGSWFHGGLAGSRFASLVYWPGGSDGCISARGACDHLNPA